MAAPGMLWFMNYVIKWTVINALDFISLSLWFLALRPSKLLIITAIFLSAITVKNHSVQDLIPLLHCAIIYTTLTFTPVHISLFILDVFPQPSCEHPNSY